MAFKFRSIDIQTGYLKLISIFLLATILLGCASDTRLKKQEIGTAVGVATGWVVGELLGGKNKARNIAVLSVMGGVLGNWLGSQLDKKDAESLSNKVSYVLQSASEGETVVWRSDHSGALAEITPIGETSKEKIIEINPISGERKTIAALNLREGPSINYSRIMTLSKGDIVTLRGKAASGWYRVMTDEGVVGFVSGKYLTQVSDESMVSKTQVGNVESNRKKMLAKNNNSTQEASARIIVRCRTVRVKIKVNGKVSEKHVETCQDPSGSWGA